MLFSLVNSSSIAQERIMEQDSSLNNLVHPEGYETLETDQLGRVVKRGKGKTNIILIAGLGLDTEYAFKQFIEDNLANYTMYVVTLAGYGHTQAYPMPADGTSYGKLTWHTNGQLAIQNLIDENSIQKPIIISHSNEGFMMGVQIALNTPEKISGIVAIGSEPYRNMVNNGQEPTYDQRVAYVDRGLAPQWFKTVTKRTWDSNMFTNTAYSLAGHGSELATKINEAPLQVMVRYLCEMWTFDPRPTYENLKTPILAIIPGFTSEFLDNPENSFYRKTFITPWSLNGGHEVFESHIIPDAGLFVHHDQPEKVNKLIKEFADQIN